MNLQMLVDLLLAATRAANNKPGAECGVHTHLRCVEAATGRPAVEITPDEWREFVRLSCS